MSRPNSDNKSILKQAEKANQAAELLLEREQDTRSQLEAQISKIKKQLEVFRDETSFELVSLKDKSREEQKTFSEMKFQLEQNMKDMENTIKSFEDKLEGMILRVSDNLRRNFTITASHLNTVTHFDISN